MRKVACLIAVLCLGTAAPASMQPPAPSPSGEGVYQSRTMEVGSTLVLSPTGRFLWAFSYGALDLASEGRWSREADGTILLNSDPVTAPRFELVGRSHDDQPGVAIRLSCDSRQAAEYLNPIVEYADGERMGDRFDNLDYRAPADDPRAVAAVYVGSLIFDLLSDRVPVNLAEANVFTFRFIPNDISRAEFRNQRVSIDHDRLTLNWRDQPLLYVREASAVGQALPPLPPVAGSSAEAAPTALEIRMEEPFQALRQRTGAALTLAPDEDMLVARGPVDLVVDYDASRIDFGRAQGGRQPLMIAGQGTGSVESVSFDLAELMPLDAALARAQALEQALEQAGFRMLPEDQRRGGFAPFTFMGADGNEGGAAADWSDAAHRLADEAQAIPAMQLFELHSNRHMVAVRLENERRHERDVCPHSAWQGEAGREWRLQVTFNPSLLAEPEPGEPR